MEENNKKKNYMKQAVLGVIILLQICVLIYCFTVKKKNYHSDELFSYGLANSYYQPFLNANDHAGLEVINNNQWLPGNVINDYLSVDEEHRFAYDSVYYNNSKDVHPPFYYMVLHTICSFFPDVYTEWFGFGLNLVLFVLSQMLIYLIVKKMTNMEFPALMAVILYGFNQGGIDTYIFIRMYAMSTFFLLMCIYLHVLLLKSEKKKNKIMVCLCLVTFFGGMTHYYYLIAAGTVSACFCVYYLIKKQYKFLAQYAILLLASVAAVIIVYPYALTQLFRFEGTHDVSSSYGGFWFEWRYILSYAASELLGMRLSVMPSYFWIHATEFLLVLIVILVPVCFLLRKEEWYKKGISGLKGMIRGIIKRLAQMNVLYISMAFSIVALLLAAAVTVPVSKMGTTATRYVFAAYPMLAILFTMLLYEAADVLQKGILFIIGKKDKKQGKGKKIQKVISVMTVLCILILNQLYTTVNFYFDYETERTIQNYIELDELPKDADYIFVLREYWLLNCLAVSFRDIQNFFATSKESVFYLGDELDKLVSENPMYLVMEIPDWREMSEDEEEAVELNEEFVSMMQTAGDIEGEKTREILREYEDFFMKLQICDCFEYIGNSAVYGREVFVFRLK